MTKSVLIVGLFLSEANKTRILRTAADQLGELLAKNNYAVITVSTKVERVSRLMDTLSTIICKRKQFDVAIVPLYGGFRSFIWEDVTSKLLKLLKKKIVLIVHGGSIPERMKKKSRRYLKAINRADIVISPSTYILYSLKEYGIKCVQIENVVNLSNYTFHPKKEFRPHLFWMRTLEDIYNPSMAVRVAAILSKKYPHFKMVMAGYDKGAMQMTKDLAIQLGVRDKIEFPGYITNEQKNKYAEELDFYICTNRIDNAPVSLIEMMALGLPVISVNTGGIPYLIQDGYNGALVNLDDDEAMAAKIISIIEHPETGEQLVKNGLIFCNNFGEAPVLKKWQRLFEQLSSN